VKRILVLLILITAGFSSCTEEDVFDEFCDNLSGVYSCAGIDMPIVVYEEMSENMRGQYRGGDTIFINENLEGLEMKSTLFHEFVHYMQVQVGTLRVPGPPDEICDAEAEAFALTDAWREINGLERVGPSWWKPYWYCWEFYGSEGGFGVWFDKNGRVTVIQ
jgi:hypothetical protein